MNIFLLPFISAIIPKGTENITAARKYDVAIHPRSVAFASNSLSIEGSATFVAEPIKRGRRKLLLQVR